METLIAMALSLLLAAQQPNVPQEVKNQAIEVATFVLEFAQKNPDIEVPKTNDEGPVVGSSPSPSPVPSPTPIPVPEPKEEDPEDTLIVEKTDKFNTISLSNLSNNNSAVILEVNFRTTEHNGLITVRPLYSLSSNDYSGGEIYVQVSHCCGGRNYVSNPFSIDVLEHKSDKLTFRANISPTAKRTGTFTFTLNGIEAKGAKTNAPLDVIFEPTTLEVSVVE